jgi:hypothetical protein
MTRLHRMEEYIQNDANNATVDPFFNESSPIRKNVNISTATNSNAPLPPHREKERNNQLTQRLRKIEDHIVEIQDRIKENEEEVQHVKDSLLTTRNVQMDMNTSPMKGIGNRNMFGQSAMFDQSYHYQMPPQLPPQPPQPPQPIQIVQPIQQPPQPPQPIQIVQPIQQPVNPGYAYTHELRDLERKLRKLAENTTKACKSLS